MHRRTMARRLTPEATEARAVFGAGEAKSIASSHKARHYLGGSADPDTLTDAPQLMGDTAIDITSIGRGGRRPNHHINGAAP